MADETRKVMITVRRAPHGSIYVHEGIKGFMASIGALVDFEVEKVYVDRQSLADRNMSEDDLVYIGEDEDTEEPLKPQVLDSAEIRRLMEQQDAIMSF